MSPAPQNGTNTQHPSHPPSEPHSSVRCVKDVNAMPGECFLTRKEDGTRSSKGAALRKLVLTNIADYAWKDGTNARMSLDTLRKRVPCGRRQLIEAISWLMDAGFLERNYKSHQGTNVYTVKPIPDAKPSSEPATVSAISNKMSQNARCNLEQEQCSLGHARCNIEHDTVQSATNTVPIGGTQTSERSERKERKNEEASQASPVPEDRGPKRKHGQEEHLPEEERLANQLSYISEGLAVFNNKQKRCLKEDLKKGNTYKELEAAFREQLAHLDRENRFEVSRFVQTFCETASQTVFKIRRMKQERDDEAAAVASARAKMEAKAEEECRIRLEALKREREESDELPE